MLGHAPLAGSPLASAGDQTLSAVGTAAGSATVAAVGASTVTAVGSSAGSATSTAASTATAASIGSSAGTSAVSGSGALVSAQTGSASGVATASTTGVAGVQFTGTSDGVSEASGVLDLFYSYGVSSGSSEALAVSSSLQGAILVGTASGTGSARGYTRQGGVAGSSAWLRGGPVSSRPAASITNSASFYIGENGLTLFVSDDADTASMRVLNSNWDDDTPAVADEWDTATVPVIDWSAVDQASTEVWEKRD